MNTIQQNDAAPSPRPRRHSRRWIEWIALAVIVGVAAWLRLGSLDLMEFKSDEAVAIELALPLVDGERLPLIGLRSSVGVNNPPLFLYLLALPLLIAPDPILATGFVGLLGTLAVALTYFILRARFGTFAALGAAALFATVPWAVLYSRKIWAQDFLPIFSVALLHCLLAIVERRKTWLVLFVPILLSALWQLHFSAFALFGVVGVLILYRAREVRWVGLVMGAALAVGLLTPYLIYQVEHGWVDFKQMGSMTTGETRGRHEAPPDLRALVHTSEISGAGNWSYVTGRSESEFERAGGPGRTTGGAASAATVFLLLGGVAAMLVRLVRRAEPARRYPFMRLALEDERRGVLVLWLLGVWAFFVLARLDGVYPHYFIVTYPVSFTVMALALSDLRDLFPPRWSRTALVCTAGTAGLLAVAFLGFNISFYGFVREQGGTAGDYGVAFGHTDELARYIVRHGLRPVAASYELSHLIVLHRRAGATREEESATDESVEIGNRLRGTAPHCPPERARSFGPLVACMRKARSRGPRTIH